MIVVICGLLDTEQGEDQLEESHSRLDYFIATVSVISICVVFDTQFDDTLGFGCVWVGYDQFVELCVTLLELCPEILVHSRTIFLVKRSTVTSQCTTNPII